MIDAVTDAGGERLAQPVGVAIAPDGAVLFTDVGRDAVLEQHPASTAEHRKIWIRRTLGLRRYRNHVSRGEPLVDCKGEVMGRGAIVILISGLMALTCGMLGPVSTRAQESTPAAETTGVEVAPGVTFDLMPASEDPPSLYRLRFAPGATLSFVDDPAISLVYVESGALSLQLDAAVSDARPEAASGDEEDADTGVGAEPGRLLCPAAAGRGGDPQRGSGTGVDRDRGHHPGMIPANAIGTPGRGDLERPHP